MLGVWIRRLISGLVCLVIVGGWAPLAHTRPIDVAVPVDVTEESAKRVPIGTRVGSLRGKDIRYLPRTLDELGERRATVLVFTTTECPLVRRYWPRLVELHRQFEPQGVRFVAINVGTGDSIRDMAAHALEFGVGFPAVKDTTGEIVRAVGATRTPEVVVLDSESTLVYRGRIDDRYRLGGVRPSATRNDLAESLTELLAGGPISVPETPVDGCRISIAPADETTSAGSTSWTYHRDVAPILAANCSSCHQRGGSAPFSLGSLRRVRSHGAMIAEVVEEQRMPPWYASPHFGVFQNDRSLSEDERRKIMEWVRGGMPEGERPKDAATPKIERAQSGWSIPEPDLVLKMVFPHRLPADGFIPYRYVVLPHVFTDDTWVEAFEIRPDNRAVVHHADLAYGAPGTKPGRRTFITGYVPGGQPLDLSRFDGDIGFKLPAYSALGLQIHYVTTGKPESSTISVGVRFKRGRVRKRLRYNLADPHRFKIPPHHPAYAIRDDFVLRQDATLLGLFAHMHLRGKDMTFLAHRPDGTTETLLQIPNYSFDWQLGYEIEPGRVRLPIGTRVEAIAHYDNSAFNPYNPDPTRTVRYGPQTVNEMMNGYVFFTYDDEDLGLKVEGSRGRAVPAKAKAKF